MRFRAAIVLAAAMAIQFTYGAVFAHHSFSGEFDNATAVMLHGIVTSVEMINPHSFIYLEVTADGVTVDGVTVDGTVQRWALEGPSAFQIRRRGLDLTFIKAGDELSACGYLARSDVVPTRTEPVTARAARKLQAAVLTRPNGEPILWSNYRQRKCGLDK